MFAIDHKKPLRAKRGEEILSPITVQRPKFIFIYFCSARKTEKSNPTLGSIETELIN